MPLLQHQVTDCITMQALERIENEDLGDSLFYEHEPPPHSVRRQVAIYEAARALIGAITPYFDEVSKVGCSPALD